MQHKRALLPVLCLLIAVPSISYATTKDDLDATRKEMAESKQRQGELEAENRKVQSELSEIQEKLVKAVAAIQQVDKDLRAAQEKLDVITVQASEKKEHIEQNKARLEALVQAALRFSKMPVEAMVVMPGDTKQRLRVSRALKMISQDIRRETETLNLQVQELKDLEQKILKHRDEIVKKQAELTKERQLLALDMDERRKIQKNLMKEQKKEAAKAAELAQKANGLQELLETLQKQQERRKAEAEAKSSGGWFTESARKGKVRSFTKAKGRLRLPVSGDIREWFGDTTKSGGTSKGVSLSASADAEVVAPYDGEVIYSGQFLTYGRMVIIKHSDDFHTLLAGLGSIDVNPGEFLLEGEPIGAMGRRGNDPRLYIELRKDNQPVNPSPWFAGLRSKK